MRNSADATYIIIVDEKWNTWSVHRLDNEKTAEDAITAAQANGRKVSFSIHHGMSKEAVVALAEERYPSHHKIDAALKE
jgi:hypothetical protein